MNNIQSTRLMKRSTSRLLYIKKSCIVVGILHALVLQPISTVEAQRNSRSKPNENNSLQKTSWIYADFAQLPNSDLNHSLFIPFSLLKQTLPFERVIGEQRFETEFDLTLSIYEIEKEKKVSDKELKAEVRISEQTRTMQFMITEQERNANRPSYVHDYFNIELPPVKENMQRVAVFELIAQNGATKSTRFSIDPSVNSSWIVPVIETSTSEEFQLLSQGNQVNYGEDFNLLILINAERFPTMVTYSDNLFESYPEITAEIFIGEDKTSNYSTTLSFTSNFKFEPFSGDDTFNTVRMVSQVDSMMNTWLYTLLEVQGKALPNQDFTVRLSQSSPSTEQSIKVIAERKFRSYWSTIPSSLLRIDLAIDRLEFILSEERIEDMKNGNRDHQIEAFYDYWTPLDPTPDTHINELMVEYYSRIDKANERYSTPSVKGFESDQGKQYILYGDPDRIERQFPPNGPSIEVWYYPAFVLTFEATSGFGDYKLIDRKTL